MATWSNQNVVLTNAGKNLLSYAQTGHGDITITRAVPGAGRVANNLLEQQTAVTNPKPDLMVVGRVADPTGSIVNIQLNNSEITEAYDLHQIALYASNPNTGEVLYLLAQCDEGTEDTIPVPGSTPTIMNFSFHLIHGSEAAVNVTISNEGLVPATVFDAHRHDNALATKDGFMSKEDKSAHDTLVQRVNQDLKKTASPTFKNITIGSLHISETGVITGAKFT